MYTITIFFELSRDIIPPSLGFETAADAVDFWQSEMNKEHDGNIEMLDWLEEVVAEVNDDVINNAKSFQIEFDDAIIMFNQIMLNGE